VPLSVLVQEVLEGYANVLAGVKCHLTAEIEPEVHGTWDRSRMEQIVVNLLGNVVKYAPGKPVHVKLSRVEGMARLEVRDSGPGIAVDRQGKIFERFERAVSSRSISGLGLGLFIARQIVEAHHGSIRVESAEGRGATFTVELPLHRVEPLKTGSQVASVQREKIHFSSVKN
jgi:signal transduction histidine kinase